MNFWTLLAMINIILKITHKIDWSWMFVLWPAWIYVAIVVFVLYIRRKG